MPTAYFGMFLRVTNMPAKKNGKRKTVRSGRMTKGLQKKVEEIARDAVVEVKETKYVSDLLNSYTSLTTASPEVDATGHRMLWKIPLVIPEGDDYKSRDGDRIHLQSMVLRFRMKPVGTSAYVSTLAPGNNPSQDYFPKTTLRMHVLRIDRGATITMGEIDECLRRPQELWSDTKQDIGRTQRRKFTLVHSFELSPEFRDTVSVNPSTIPPEQCISRFPRITFSQKRIKLDKVTTFNASSSNEPVKYEYYLFGTWGRYNRGSGLSQVFPDYLNIWKSFYFKDL